MKLESYVTQESNISVLELSGRFDAYEAPEVRSWVEAQMTIGTTNLVVDLQDVNFIDSTGLAVLVQGMKSCRQKKGDLVLSGLQQPVRIIFELTRLDRAFDIYTIKDDAVNALK